MAVKKDRSTPENRAFWDAVAEAARTVEAWPPWKKGEPTRDGEAEQETEPEPARDGE